MWKYISRLFQDLFQTFSGLFPDLIFPNDLPRSNTGTIEFNTIQVKLHQSWINFHENVCQKIKSGKLFSFSVPTDKKIIFPDWKMTDVFSIVFKTAQKLKEPKRSCYFTNKSLTLTRWPENLVELRPASPRWSSLCWLDNARGSEGRSEVQRCVTGGSCSSAKVPERTSRLQRQSRSASAGDQGEGEKELRFWTFLADEKKKILKLKTTLLVVGENIFGIWAKNGCWDNTFELALEESKWPQTAEGF